MRQVRQGCEPMKKQTKWGGRPAGSTNQARGLPEAKRVQVRFYPQNLQDAQQLIDLGYGSSRSEVVRKALAEVLAAL